MTDQKHTIYHTATAIKSPDHLKRWLEASGRQWLIMRSVDLVDALPWPDGVDVLMQVVEAYRQHRMGIPVEFDACPRLARPREHNTRCPTCSGRGTVITRSKTDLLEVDEMKEACVWLINQIMEKDKTWNPFR